MDTARPGSIKYMSDRLLRRCGHITTQEPPVINEALWLEVLHSSLALMRDLGGRDVTGLWPMYIGKSPMNSAR